MNPALVVGLLRFLVAVAPDVFKLWQKWHESGMDLEDFLAQADALDALDVDEILDGD